MAFPMMASRTLSRRLPRLSLAPSSSRSSPPCHRTFSSRYTRRSPISWMTESKESSSDLPSDDSTRAISYLTDVEGDRDYLARFVQQSRVLTFRPVEAAHASDSTYSLPFPYDHCIDFIHHDDMLVFGGDAWDQGGSDLYVIRQLLYLKARYPNRVFFVVGNRDVNKMRMVHELGQEGSVAAPPHRGVYWLHGTGREGDPSSGLLLSEDPVQRLQWMLRETMGSPRAFEHRRYELEQQRFEQGQSDPVVDLDVVESYRQSTNPWRGEMAHYLMQAELAVKIGDILFIHGALPLIPGVMDAHGDSPQSLWADMTFAMPWLPKNARAHCDTIYEWFAALNYFLRDSVDAWQTMSDRMDDPLWAVTGGYRPYPSYSNLVQYGMGGIPGGRGNNPTVIYQSWSMDGMPRRFFDQTEIQNQRYLRHVRDFFQRADLKLIVSGHQPQGDMPNTIRVDLPGDASPAFIVCSDTSYSGDTKWFQHPSDTALRQNLGRGSSRSGRGEHAVTEVLIEQSRRTSRVKDVMSHGFLSDGTPFQTRGLFQEDEYDLMVGTLASGTVVPSPLDAARPWWTRAAFSDGSFLLTAGKGFDCWNHIVKPHKVIGR